MDVSYRERFRGECIAPVLPSKVSEGRIEGVQTQKGTRPLGASLSVRCFRAQRSPLSGAALAECGAARYFTSTICFEAVKEPASMRYT